MKKQWGVLALLLAGAMTSVAQAETVLRFSWWGGNSRHQATLKAIELFEARNPGVKIKPEFGGWGGHLEKITVQMAGRNEPDIMQINWNWLWMFSRQGDGYLDMNKYKNLLKLDEFSPAAIQPGIVNGKLNALPSTYTARMWFWQKETFTKAGLPLPKTWDEMLADGKVFEQKLGREYYTQDGINYDVILMSHAWIFQKTGKQYIDPKQAKVALTVPEALEWVRFYKKLSSSHAVVPLKERVSVAADNPTEQSAMWTSGKWAGNYTWDASLRPRLSTLKNTTLEVGPFLTQPGAKNSGMFGRPANLLAVSKNTKSPEMAVKFVNFILTDPDAQKILGVERGLPVTKIGLETAKKNNLILPLEIKAYEQVSHSKIDLPSPLLEHPRINSFMMSVFESLAYDKITEQEAAERLVHEGNSILRRL